VCARQSLARVEAIAEGVVSVHVVDDLGSVGEWYDDFTQTSDDEVIRLLTDESPWRRTSQQS
jgi:putative phosphoribosyl transferase